MAALEYSHTLGRMIRSGNWNDQVVSTYQKICESICAGEFDDATGLIDYFIVEAKVCYDVFTQWADGLRGFGCAQGIEDVLWQNEITRLCEVLHLPHGEIFQHKKEWVALIALADALKSAIWTDTQASCLFQMDRLREHWRRLHDRYTDLVNGLLTYIVIQLGEEAIDPAYRSILVPFFNERYARFDTRINSWGDILSTNLYLSIESMRGHLSGPRRWGEVELVEEPERWVLRSDPCGSCGRAVRGCSIEKTPSRAHPPYNFGATLKAYPWSWSQKGVDYYEIHVCYLFEILPIENWGYPVRVVEGPNYIDGRSEKCRWYIYKDFRTVPSRFFERLGKSKLVYSDKS